MESIDPSGPERLDVLIAHLAGFLVFYKDRHFDEKDTLEAVTTKVVLDFLGQLPWTPDRPKKKAKGAIPGVPA